MDFNTNEPVWNEKEADNDQRPRQPKNTDQSKSSATNQESIIARTTLNVNAKEWVPQNMQNTSYNAQGSDAKRTYTSAQERLERVRIDAPPDNTTSDYEVLKDITRAVTSDPGQFEEYMENFLYILMTHKDDSNMIINIANFIFTQAIKEASFRYNGARLCALIYQEESRVFKAQIDNLCTQELQKNPQNTGLTLFIAELYTQINAPDYAKLLFESISNLLNVKNDDNVKTVCQTLKLCGRTLEAESEQKMQTTFAGLELSKDIVKPNIKSLIESVEKLRSSNWGGNSSYPGPSSNMNGINWDSIPCNLEKPIFYGPDGVEISEDQHRFLNNECGIIDEDDFDDPDELYDPEPEMDEEIQAAFKEFLKMKK